MHTRLLVATALLVIVAIAGCLDNEPVGPDAYDGGGTGTGASLHGAGDDRSGHDLAANTPPTDGDAIVEPVDGAPHSTIMVMEPGGHRDLGGHLEVRIDEGDWQQDAWLATTEPSTTHPGDNGLLRLPVPDDGHLFEVRFVLDDDRVMGDDWSGRWSLSQANGHRSESWRPGSIIAVNLSAPGGWAVDLYVNDPHGYGGGWGITGGWEATWLVTGTIASDLPATGATANRVLAPAEGPVRVTAESRATADAVTGLGRTLVLSALGGYGYAECRGGADLAADQDDTHHVLTMEEYEQTGAIEVWVGAPAQGCYKPATRFNVEDVPYELVVSVEPTGYGGYRY